MSRQHAAAQQLEAAADEVVAFIEQCPESVWIAVTSDEGWTVAALAHHCAVGNDVALGWVCQMLAGRPVRETPDSHNESNAADSERFHDLRKDEVLAALRRTIARTAQFLRTLTDAELERSAHLGVAERDMTVGQFIPNFARHLAGHLASLNSAASDRCAAQAGPPGRPADEG